VNEDRDRLAAALTAPDASTYWQWRKGYLNPDAVIDALLPTVRAMQAEAAAEALEEAAEVVSRSRGIKFHGAAVRDLRDRAAALRAVTSHHVAATDGTDGPERPAAVRAGAAGAPGTAERAEMRHGRNGEQ
jgi:hypothetical protein